MPGRSPSRSGIVFINVKNIIDHKALAAASPFPSIDAATKAAGDQIEIISASVRSGIVEDAWADVFKAKKACPLVALMGQMTVSAEVIPGVPLFVPIKVLRVLIAPPYPSDHNELLGMDSAAWRLRWTPSVGQKSG
jgi:hypothetical protein